MGVCVVGSINLDVVVFVDHLPRPGETVIARHRQQFPGGKGANQAIAAVRMGARTRLVGAVGADHSGAWMCEYLAHAGIDVDGVRTVPEDATGQAYISVLPSGENTIIVASGANNALRPADIPAALVEDCSVLLAQQETPTPTIAALLAGNAAKRSRKILNAAPAHAAGRDLFTLADILVMNETELAKYADTSLDAASVEAVTAVANRLLSRDGQTIVVTLGAAGVVAVGRTRSYTLAGRKAEAVDTTGAGDCFCGALAAALDEGMELDGALKLAVIAASLSVERPGAATAMPTRAEVEQFLPA